MNTHRISTRTARTLSRSVSTGLLLGLLAVGSAQAACGCPDDGHGSPQKPAATGTSVWLASLLDWRPAKPPRAMEATAPEVPPEPPRAR